MSWYNKYRPKTFDEVIEQTEAKSLLATPTAVSILYGASGVGKTTMARILATNVDAEVIEIDGATNNGVDNIRSLINSAYYAPPFHAYRMFIIDECHMLTTQAWNALLKVLEECPKTTMWVLCTTELAKIPATIKSRSVLVPLRLISQDAIAEYLTQVGSMEGYALDEKVFEIAHASGGRMREAIVMLESYLTTGVLNIPLNQSKIITLIQAVYDQDYSFIADNTKELSNDDVFQLIRFIADYTTMLLVRIQYSSQFTTESILEEYTNIPVHLLGNLREMQDSIWKQVEFEDASNPAKASVHLLHGLYEELMKHYNDFGDNRASIKEGLLWYSSQL